MFQRLDCVCLHTSDLDASLSFYRDMGLTEAWRLDRTLDDGRPWTLVGLDFPDRTSSQLTLSTHPDRRIIDVEIRVENVEAAMTSFGQCLASAGLPNPSRSKRATSR